MAQATEPSATLEAALDKIAADNNLTSVTVGRMPCGDLLYYTATVHYDGPAANGIGCSSAHAETSICAALDAALRDAAANRTPLMIAPDALPTLEMAA